MKDIFEVVKKKVKAVDTKKKRIFAAGVVLGVLILSRGLDGKEEKNVYLVDLEDKFKNEMVLLDEDGNPVDIGNSDVDKMVALVSTEKTKKDKNYQAVLVDENGNMYPGYMDGKYLEDKSIDKVEVFQDVLDETNVVYAQDGLWLREDESKTIDRNTEDAYCLPNGANVATSSVSEISKSNSYQWKEAVYVDGEELKHGYLISDYIRNKNFDEIEGKRFIIDSSLGLKLRSNSSTDSDILEQLADGQEIVLLPNVSSVSDGTYDWFYIAANTKEGIKTGYAAATYYKPDEIIHYLKSKEEHKEATEKEEKMIIKEVNTSSDGKAPLKLREEPGIDAKIISEIEHGTKIYTYQSLIDQMNSSKEVDNHKWIQVYLNNGKTGYVASEFIEDENISTSEEDYSASKMYFDDEGTRTGYFGIDIKNTVPAVKFETLFDGSVDYGTLTYNVSRNLSSMDQPSFVMFRLGSTYTSTAYDTAAIVPENYEHIDNLRSMVAICEEKHIPYGFYYYSQAINKNDADIEAQYIKETLSQLGTSNYHILPFAADMEEYVYVNGASVPTRVLVNAQEKGKSEQTKVLEYLMNKIRDDNSIDVITYLSHSGYDNLINSDELSPINQKNSWVVSPSSAHSNPIANNYPEVSKNSSIWQIGLDGITPSNVPVDVDFIDKQYFDNLLSENKINKANNNKVYRR